MTKSNESKPEELSDEMSRFMFFFSRFRYVLSATTHIVLFTLALLLAYLVWFDAGPNAAGQAWFFESFIKLLPFFVIVKAIIFGWRKLFRGGWQYAGIRDVARILLASWIFVAVAFACVFVFVYLPKMHPTSAEV